MKFITNYFLRHCQAAVNSLGQFSRTPLASLMTCLVIGIALALPTALFVALKNFENISGNFQQSMQITLYLKPESTETDITKLISNLKTRPDIASVISVSPAQGLKELQQTSGFQGALLELADNPLPWTVLVQPNTPENLNSLTSELQALPLVSSLQVDKLWVERLASLMSLSQRAFYAVAIFLGLAVFLIINNVIRSTTQQNHREIEIIKLIGGTYGFIRRPFLYTGAIYGLLGGIAAWQLVDILLLVLKDPVHRLTTLYNSQFLLTGIGLSNTLILLGSSMLLGLLGSWLAVTRHLKTC